MMYDTLRIVIVLLASVILHEYAHGWVAYRLGDPTAKMSGRLTLNPLKHLDPIGSLLVPFVLRMLGFLPIGWAKPVPVNFAQLNNPKRDMIFVAAAGPATNLVLAFLLSQLMHVTMPYFLYKWITVGVVINLVLAIFNLIPIPPLDGSRIVLGFIPRSFARYYLHVERYGIIILLILINLGYLNFMGTMVAFMAHIFGVDVRFI